MLLRGVRALVGCRLRRVVLLGRTHGRVLNPPHHRLVPQVVVTGSVQLGVRFRLFLSPIGDRRCGAVVVGVISVGGFTVLGCVGQVEGRVHRREFFGLKGARHRPFRISLNILRCRSHPRRPHNAGFKRKR